MKSAVLFADNEYDIRTSKLTEYELHNLKDYPNGFNFEPGVRYLVIGQEAYKLITGEPNNIHLGLRNEYFYECTLCKYLTTREGVVFKFEYLNYESNKLWLSESEYNVFERNIDKVRERFKDAKLAKGISKKNNKPWYRCDYRSCKVNDDTLAFLTDEHYTDKKIDTQIKYSKIIRDNESIKNAFQYFIDTPGYIGLDYETGGIPFEDPDFEVMGVGIANVNGIAAYFDIEYMTHLGGNLEYFLSEYKRFLDARHYDVYTYNVGFELRTTYLLLHKFYNFNDSACINYIEGNQYRRFSLKYTAISYCNVASWDDDFDYLGWKLDLMMNGYHTKKENIPAVPYDEYQNCSHWKEICERYPDDIDEFKRLLAQSWGNQYKCIPSRILGSYCNLDAFYTALIRVASDNLGYSKTCWDTFADNLRLDAHLNMSGFHQDTEFKEFAAYHAEHYLVYGQYNAVIVYLSQKLRRFDVDKFKLTEGLKFLLERNIDITNSKGLIMRYINPNTDHGIDEVRMYEELGDELAQFLIQFLLSRYQVVPPSIARTKSVFTTATSELMNKYGMSITDGGFIVEGNFISLIDYRDAVDYYSTLQLYEDLYSLRICMNNILRSITFRGRTYTMMEFVDYLKNIFNLSSAEPYDNFIRNIFIDNPQCYIYAMSAHRTKTELPEGTIIRTPDQFEVVPSMQEKYNELLGVYNERRSLFDIAYSTELDAIVDSGFLDKRIVDQYKRSNELSTIYDIIEDKLVNIRKGKIKYAISEDLQTHITNFETGARALFSLIKSDYWIICCAGTHFYHNIKWSEKDTDLLRNDDGSIDCLGHRIIDCWKLAYSIRLFRKYIKNYGTYLTGLLCENQTTVNPPDDYGISTQKHYKGSDAIIKCYPSFNAMGVKSKRWSAGIHTVPSKDECKKIIHAPSGRLLSYFDISAAEVRTISYISKDPEMIKQWEAGKDLYVETCKLVYPDMPMSEIKGYWRGVFKTVLLGKLYRMSDQTLSENAQCSLEDAINASTQLFSIFKVAKAWGDAKSEYAGSHGGRIETILGDKLIIRESDPDKLLRQGVNVCVQGFTALALTSGFYQCHRAAIESDGYFKLRPLTVVHDSCTNEFNTERLFEIGQFYYKNMTQFLYDRFGIRYKFGTFIGDNYFDVSELDPIEEGKKIGLTGSASSLNKILGKLDEINYPYRFLVGNREMLVPSKPKSIFDAFYGRWGECVYDRDYSSYHIELESLA